MGGPLTAFLLPLLTRPVFLYVSNCEKDERLSEFMWWFAIVMKKGMENA